MDQDEPKPTKWIRLQVDDETHTAIRHLAADAGVPMSRYVRELVRKEGKKWKPRK